MPRLSKGILSVKGATNKSRSCGNAPPHREKPSRASTPATTQPSSFIPNFQLFVYDTELLRCEWDDPAEAVIFTHPVAVPVERKLAIAGTLAGVFNFFEQLMGDEVSVLFDAFFGWMRNRGESNSM